MAGGRGAIRRWHGRIQQRFLGLDQAGIAQHIAIPFPCIAVEKICPADGLAGRGFAQPTFKAWTVREWKS